MKHAIVVAMACMVGAAQSQTMNVRGKITATGNRPVSGATVELLRAQSRATSTADGSYSLTSTRAFGGAAPSAAGSMAFAKGVLELNVAEPAPVRIEIVTADGTLLDRTTLDRAEAGAYRLDLSGRAGSGSLLIVKASIGRESRAFPYFRMSGGAATAQASLAFAPRPGARLAKISAVIDTLQVTAAGLTAKKVPITSYDTTVNVTLDSAGDYWGGLKNPPGKSAGCGKAAGVTNGEKTITSRNQSRRYTIDIPANYDMNKPYRFFYCSHWISARMQDVVGQNYYFLKPLVNAANEPAIFLAPQALPGNPTGTWASGQNDSTDNVLFMDILAYVKANLCIDTTRVFATGFSFGGMMTYSLSENRQLQIRAAVGIAPANYNIYVPPKKRLPIAWMQTTGMSDGTTPWVNNEAQRRGSKFIALDHAIDNGCTPPAGNNIPTSNGAHSCYDFQGCKAGYPVKACTFGGGHTNIQSDPGSNVNWIPQESWNFFKQF